MADANDLWAILNNALIDLRNELLEWGDKPVSGVELSRLVQDMRKQIEEAVSEL